MQNLQFEQKKSRIGGIVVNSPILLGAGVIKNPLTPELTEYLNVVDMVGAVTIGSITSNAREGNEGVLNWPKVRGEYDIYTSEGGLHANGMRNLGIVETMNNLPKDVSKPIIISVAGYSVEDYIFVLKTIISHKNSSLVKAIEINCSCPTMGRAPLAYSIEAMTKLFIEIKNLQFVKPLWFKLSPYFTNDDIEILHKKYPQYDFTACPTVSDSFLDELYELLREYENSISAVIISNGLPLVGRGDKIQVKKANGSFSTIAGLSGPILKDGNLKTIKFMKDKGLTVDILGCGGVLTKEDMADYFASGAKAVQCSGGPIWGGGVTFFNNL